MALTSPGVQVSVIDESFYTPSEPGTVPLIFVATQENKTNPSGTGVAPGTLKANAGKVYSITSQRELAETFGDPLFYTDASNNPIHGGEQNEYGLQAAYSFLGVSNRAYIVRADLDLAAISASATETAGKPTNGSYWFDIDDTRYGIFEWNGSDATVTSGQTFTNKVPTVITNSSDVVDFAGSDYTPKASIGSIGDYAIVAVTTLNKLWYKNIDNTWVEVGSSTWKQSWPIVTGESGGTITIGEDIVINSETVTATGTTITSLASDINNSTNLQNAGISGSVANGRLQIISSGTTDSITIAGDATLLTAVGITAGTYNTPVLNIAAHTSVPEWKSGDTTPRPTGSIWVKSTTPNLGANWNVKLYNSALDTWTSVTAPMYASNHAAINSLDSSGGGTNIPEGSLYIQHNTTETTTPLANFKIFRKNGSGPLNVLSTAVPVIATGSYTFTVSESVVNSNALSSKTVNVTIGAGDTTALLCAEKIVEGISAAGLSNVSATVDSQARITITHRLGGEIRITDTDSILGILNPTNVTKSNYVPGTDAGTSPKQYLLSHWAILNYTAKDTAPTQIPETGTLWYSSIVDEIDIMYHDGSDWVGYRTGSAFPNSDASGPIVSSAAPTAQANGDPLVEGDLWVSTADLENFPTIYRRNATGRWVLLDKTDQTTDLGVLFADARYSTAGANIDAADIADMLESNYLDPDAPDPVLYPKGMILWNTRRSGFNVKRFERNWIDVNENNIRTGDESMADYYPHRWVTESANNVDGSGSFGRNAQRKVVVQQLQAAVNNNEDIRDNESRVFNLMATPSYPELIGEMISLNNDRGLTAFIVGDTPMRLEANSTSINNWVNNINLAVEDNDNGLVSRDEYLGVYYPAGFSSDNFGNNIVVPPSHMVLRTIALNDQVAYPWFAPAGTRRGGVTNATASGYINNEGEFVSVALNEGQRDTLYQANVNPITFLNGAGLVVFGQKTRARNASALDRVNVARLVVYLRRQLQLLAKPYIFEPNDKITRDQIKAAAESLMLELQSLRAIYDYLVVCDESNNPPARIDRNELYVDIAIEPTKAIEFIYIPLRLKNTGEIAGL